MILTGCSNGLLFDNGFKEDCLHLVISNGNNSHFVGDFQLHHLLSSRDTTQQQHCGKHPQTFHHQAAEQSQCCQVSILGPKKLDYFCTIENTFCNCKTVSLFWHTFNTMSNLFAVWSGNSQLGSWKYGIHSWSVVFPLITTWKLFVKCQPSWKTLNLCSFHLLKFILHYLSENLFWNQVESAWFIV